MAVEKLRCYCLNHNLEQDNDNYQYISFISERYSCEEPYAKYLQYIINCNIKLPIQYGI